MADVSTLNQRIKNLESRLALLEVKHKSTKDKKPDRNNSSTKTDDTTPLPTDAFVNTMCVKALALGFRNFQFKRCPDRYYKVELDQRKEILSAPSVDHLCKSIVMENTRCTNEGCEDPLNSRYYCVVVQYTRKLNGEKVFRFVRNLNTGRGIARKNFNFQLAKDSASVTGFDYNAVTPVGMKTRMPVIVAEEIMELNPKEFWLGGGEVSLKWRVTIEEFKNAFNPFVGDITFENGDEEDLE